MPKKPFTISRATTENKQRFSSVKYTKINTHNPTNRQGFGPGAMETIMQKAWAHKRKSASKKREIRSLTNGENAHVAIGELYKGCEIFGFSKGQFSLINLVIAVLEQTGPATVSIATWTAAKKEIHAAERLLRIGNITEIRFLVDFSFPRRQPSYCELLREKFGDVCIRVTATHAKFIMIRNDKWNIVIRTSMNLNKNDRFETFEISDDIDMADFLDGVIDDIYESQEEGSVVNERPIDHVNEFKKYGIDAQKLDDNQTKCLGKNFDDPSQSGFAFND